MFFIVSKILSFLLTPISWIIVLFVISIIVHSKSTKKKIRTFCIILLVLFSNPFLHKQTVLWWQAKPVTLAPNNHYSAGILLGGIIFFDKNNVGYFDNAADRFIQAEKLYHQGFIEKIIATGGSSAIFHKEPKEADFLQHELLASGVAEKDILIDNTARNTFENAVNTKKIIDSLHLKEPFILISSATHIPRATKVFEKEKIKVIPFPCDYDIIDTPFSLQGDLLPDLGLLSNWQTIIKEIIGTKVYELSGKA